MNKSRLLPAGTLLVSAMSMAAYDPSDSVTSYAELGYVYDSNVFRLSDDQNTQQALGKDTRSDSIVTPKVGGHVDATVSRQVFSADADVYAPRYITFSNLNYVGWDASLGWTGDIGHSWFGSATLQDQKALSDFGDVVLNEEDFTRTTTASGQLGYHINSSFSLIGNASDAKVDHSRENSLDLRNENYGLKVQYQTDLGGTLSLGEQYQRVTYDQGTFNGVVINSDYTQRITQISAYYPIDAKLSISGGYGLVKLQTDQTDESDWQANAAVNWRPTDKTSLALSYQHALNSPGSTFGQSIRSHYQLYGSWAITEKISTNATLAYDKYDYPAALNVAAYNDNVKFAKVGATWTPKTSIQTSIYASYQQRDSTVELRTYDDWQLGATIRVLF